MPLAWDMSDQRLLFQQHMATEDFIDQVKRAFATLYAEAAATGSGRILTVTITPWLMGQPHRINALGAVLDHILEHAGVWPATGAEIVDASGKRVAQGLQVAAARTLPTSSPPFQRRASMTIATRPIALITVMPRKACWP